MPRPKSNPEPADIESDALTTELPRLEGIRREIFLVPVCCRLTKLGSGSIERHFSVSPMQPYFCVLGLDLA